MVKIKTIKPSKPSGMTSFFNSKFQQQNISDQEAAQLRHCVLFDKQYLGSSVYEYVFGQFDDDLYHLLFDGHSKTLYEQKGQRPSVVLGRRGAGKSTYLNYLSHKENVISIGLKTWDLIDLVEQQVKVILEHQAEIDAEKCADIWQLVLLTIACCETTKFLSHKGAVKEFLSALPIGDFAKNSILQVAGCLIESLKTAYLKSASNFDVELCLKAMKVTSKTLDDVEKALSNVLLKSNKIVIFMLDNPERFTRHSILEASLVDNTRYRELTLSGLLNLVGRYNQGNTGLQIRLCIPTEQYFYLKRISSNRRKDFGSAQVLHWSSGEILSMAAHRYLTFLTVYQDYVDSYEYEKLLGFAIYTREGAIKFWDEIFESTLINCRGLSERPLVYLLRHTQLVPRQLLDFLNKAIDFELKANNKNLAHIASVSLVQAIADVEYNCSSEVIDSFSYSYPEANEMFDLVFPNLPVVCSVRDLRTKLYKTTEAKAVLQRNCAHPQVLESKDRFVRLLIETGVYGKVNHQPREGSTGYIEAEFEYTIMGNLRVMDSDVLAMHPLFACNLNPKLLSGMVSEELGVYPVGTNCDL